MSHREGLRRWLWWDSRRLLGGDASARILSVPQGVHWSHLTLTHAYQWLNFQEFCELLAKHSPYEKIKPYKVITEWITFKTKVMDTQNSSLPNCSTPFCYYLHSWDYLLLSYPCDRITLLHSQCLYHGHGQMPQTRVLLFCFVFSPREPVVKRLSAYHCSPFLLCDSLTVFIWTLNPTDSTWLISQSLKNMSCLYSTAPALNQAFWALL